MDMNLKAFMKAELKERGTVEFPGVATFTDEKGNPVPFIIKQLYERNQRDPKPV